MARRSEFDQLYGDFAAACNDIEDARRKLRSLIPRINARRRITLSQCKKLSRLWEQLMDWFGPAEELTDELLGATNDLQERSGISDEDLVD